MLYLLALLPATVLTIGGYLVLFAAGRTEGPLRTFGKYLGFWAFTLAGLVILGALFAAAHGGRHCPGYGMRGMQGGYCPWRDGARFEPGKDGDLHLPGEGTGHPAPPGPNPPADAGAPVAR